MPFIINQLPEKVLVNENGLAKLECEIGGSPTPTINWVKRGEDLVSSKEKGIEIYSDGNKYTLTIDSSKMNDSGVYNIDAQNRVGKVTTKTELIVQRKFNNKEFLCKLKKNLF